MTEDAASETECRFCSVCFKSSVGPKCVLCTEREACVAAAVREAYEDAARMCDQREAAARVEAHRYHSPLILHELADKAEAYRRFAAESREKAKAKQ